MITLKMRTDIKNLPTIPSEQKIKIENMTCDDHRFVSCVPTPCNKRHELSSKNYYFRHMNRMDSTSYLKYEKFGGIYV